MASVDKLARMSDRHSTQRDSIIVLLVKALFGVWGRQSASFYNETQIAGQAAESVQLVMSAQARVRTLTNSYATSVLRELDALPAKLPTPVAYYPRSGVDPIDVYSRPAVQFQWQRSIDKPLDEATRIALERLEDLAETDVKLAERDEITRVYGAAPKVTGFRRIIHPELSRSGTCGLCAVAATRFYTKQDLLPLHFPSCNCDTLPITKGDDPGFRLNEDDLKQVYAQAGSTAADDLRNTRITINEHGELGPVLAKDGEHFRSAKELGRPDWVKATPDVIRSRQEANVENTRREITKAEAALAAFIDTHPDVAPGDSPRLGMFRAVKSLNDLLKAQQAALARTTT